MENDKIEKENMMHRYLNGIASPREIEILEADAGYLSYVKIAKATRSFESPSFNKEKNFEAIRSKLHGSPKIRKSKPIRLFLRVAATAAILFVGYLFIKGSETTITTEIAQKQEFLLPDDSKVILNAQSEISFNKNKWDGERRLQLNGEAFFKVNTGKTFSVETSQGVVQVLGTQFNVFARDSLFDIKCYEGMVSVSYGDTTVQVPTGTRLEIINRDRVHQSRIMAFSPDWIANESTFENVSLSLVLEELQRQYPIKIISQNIVNKRFTGSFTHTDLNVALRAICDPLQVDFKIEGGEVTLYAKKNN